MKKKFQNLSRNKKILVILIGALLLIILLLVMKSIFFSNNVSKYGDRLDGIEDISFTKSDKSKITDSISGNDKVSEAKLSIHGKIINVIFNVNEDVSIDDAKTIANDSLSNFSDEVKNFYDIEYIITKNDEKGTETEVTDDDGNTKTETVKEFPIMGYKNSKSESIVW